ncbi:hypothetical protein ACOSQ2_031394 [Xanthoceras sorbifolium]
MEKLIILVDNFWHEGYLLPLDYHRLLCKEIIRYHRSIKLPNQSFVGIIGCCTKHFNINTSLYLYRHSFKPLHTLRIIRIYSEWPASFSALCRPKRFTLVRHFTTSAKKK